jgi:putative ABC transport system permease protein
MRRYLLIFKLAIKGILTNKVRSFLTILGIVIGIASVIALMGLGAGAQNEITENISSLGTEVATVIPGGGGLLGQGQQQGPPGTSRVLSEVMLTEKDYDYLNNSTRFPYIQFISPEVRGVKEAKRGQEDIIAPISGVSESFDDIQELEVLEGAFFSGSDVSDNRNVAVIGFEVSEKLFSGENPADAVGESIIIDNSKFKVVGVIETQGTTALGNQDENIYIPYTTAAERLFDTEEFSNIRFKVSDVGLLDATIGQVEEKLANYRGVDENELDFSIFTSEDLLETVNVVTGIFTTLLAGIAAISLLVGGIGISNIMLVSVTERTKEIGLRKAVGAKRRDILVQFIIEAIVLTLLGGILGIFVGILLGWGVGSLASINSSITWESIFLATGVSIIIGIIFGFAPAYKAARLDPIDALRYE